GADVLAQKKGKVRKYDIVVYGGTSAGVAAAPQASRSGKSVVLIEPGRRLGGLTTGRLGATDTVNKDAIGGIAREFYGNIYKYYQNPDNWKCQKREEYRQHGDRPNSPAHQETMWTVDHSATLRL